VAQTVQLTTPPTVQFNRKSSRHPFLFQLVLEWNFVQIIQILQSSAGQTIPLTTPLPVQSRLQMLSREPVFFQLAQEWNFLQIFGEEDLARQIHENEVADRRAARRAVRKAARREAVRQAEEKAARDIRPRRNTKSTKRRSSNGRSQSPNYSSSSYDNH
jgi:hypothetical protein